MHWFWHIASEVCFHNAIVLMGGGFYYLQDSMTIIRRHCDQRAFEIAQAFHMVKPKSMCISLVLLPDDKIAFFDGSQYCSSCALWKFFLFVSRPSYISTFFWLKNQVDRQCSSHVLPLGAHPHRWFAKVVRPNWLQIARNGRFGLKATVLGQSLTARSFNRTTAFANLLDESAAHEQDVYKISWCLFYVVTIQTDVNSINCKTFRCAAHRTCW